MRFGDCLPERGVQGKEKRPLFPKRGLEKPPKSVAKLGFDRTQEQRGELLLGVGVYVDDV